MPAAINRLAEANGLPPTLPQREPTLLDAFKLLSSVTPAQAAEAQAANERDFHAARERYLRQKKLLRMLSGASCGPKTTRAERQEKVRACVARFGTATRDEIAAELGQLKGGTSKTLASLVASGVVKEKSGRYSCVK